MSQVAQGGHSFDVDLFDDVGTLKRAAKVNYRNPNPITVYRHRSFGVDQHNIRIQRTSNDGRSKSRGIQGNKIFYSLLTASLECMSCSQLQSCTTLAIPTSTTNTSVM